VAHHLLHRAGDREVFLQPVLRGEYRGVAVVAPPFEHHVRAESPLIGKTPFCVRVPGCIMVGCFCSRTARMDDLTERTRVRQSVSQHKLTLTICALLTLVGIVGWLTTL
jgi:hypothetical protein